MPRVVGLTGAVLLGMGSILGTGIFVSVGIAAGVAGPAVLLAVALAAGVAVFNGLSSAELAASHPVSGGTYEYGHRYLSPSLGFVAGWMFLCAKSASAATAALGFAGYVLVAFGIFDQLWRVAVGVGGVVVLTAITAGGMRRSNRTNAVIVSFTLVALFAFIGFGLPSAFTAGGESYTPFLGGEDGLSALLHATALMFVAYTGYGRIATLGEEIHEPTRNIPRAILITLFLAMVVYIGVAWVGVGAAGASGFFQTTRTAAAPLELIARDFGVPGFAEVIALAAVTAMLGVLLNLLLGLSRVLLAMARRGDMPSALSVVHPGTRSPARAVVVTGGVIAALVLLGDVKTTWSFSAFTVLVYYAITNLAALRLPREHRLYPIWVPAVGLAACLGLAFWVEVGVWLSGIGVIGGGLIWHAIARRRRETPSDDLTGEALPAPRSEG